MKNKLKHKTLLTFIAYLSINFFFSFSQDKTKIYLLQSQLKEEIHDTTCINILNLLAREFQYTNPDTAIYYSKQAFALAEKAGWKKGLANSYHKLGWFNYLKGNYPLALKYDNQALKIRQELKDKKGIAATIGNIGIVYTWQGDYPKALVYYFKALEMNEELGAKKNIATNLGNIGIVYHRQGDLSTDGSIRQANYSKALEYFLKALKMDEELGNRNGIARHLGNIGIVYYEQGDSPKALEYYFKALEIAKKIGDKTRIAIWLSNIGTVYHEQGDLSTDNSIRQASHTKALEYYFKALKIAVELGNKKNTASILGNIGSLYTVQKKYPEAKRYLLQALETSGGIRALNIKMQIEQSLSELYEQTSKPTKALEHYKLYSQAKDSLFNEEKSKEIGKLEARAEYDKQLALQQAEQEKKEALAEERANKQRIIIWAVSGGLLLLAVFAFFIVHRLRITRRQKNIIQKQKQVVDEKNRVVEEKNKEITQKNKDITDSIRYAQNIQQAILPKDEEIKSALPEHFVFFAPKDIVSGDFYWFIQKNGKAIIAACDCTGHGVPGAFVSMIGNDLLNQIIIEKGVESPGEILTQLSNGIKSVFTREGTEQQAQDGMDITLCEFDKDLKTVRFAGANNPLFLIRDGELIQTKGDRAAIGGETPEDYEFANHTLKLQKDDCLYIFSDGYQDQFGGPRGKKFMKKRLKEFLLSIQSKSMGDQGKALNKTIEEWKGGREQVDDILVIGVRI